MDCGTEIGNAAKYNQRLCAKKHFAYMGTTQVVMPENYIAMFAVPGENEAGMIIEKAETFYANDKCISCGKCVALCPLNNIKLENGKKSVGKPRYYCEKGE